MIREFFTDDWALDPCAGAEIEPATAPNPIATIGSGHQAATAATAESAAICQSVTTAHPGRLAAP